MSGEHLSTLAVLSLVVPCCHYDVNVNVRDWRSRSYDAYMYMYHTF